MTPTDWSTSVEIQKFDQTLGSLSSVSIVLSGTLKCEVGAENRSYSPATVILSASATVKLELPDGQILQSNPGISEVKSFSAFDGNFDWAGTSGYTNTIYGITPGTSTNIVGNLSFFIGEGYFQLPITASAVSHTTCDGNVASYYFTSSSALVSVAYDYTPVPEPASLTALISGITALCAFAIRRKH